MTRAVVDVTVLVSALISPEGVAARLVQHTANRDFELVMSPRLVREPATVTRRSRFRRYFSIDEAERLITDLWDLGLRVDDAEEVPAVTRDPDDDYLVALVPTSQADALVSGDRDLLDLTLSELEVLAPREFVERLDAGELACGCRRPGRGAFTPWLQLLELDGRRALSPPRGRHSPADDGRCPCSCEARTSARTP